ncbi:MAG: dehydrogenase, partial [Gemmatimonadales bacterium]|nr:dehydrogenase [Gemmatimonadales bacterium]
MGSRRVAVLGGGHGARTVAADLALAGHEIRLFEFEEFRANVADIFERQTIEITGKARVGVGKLALATHEIGEAIRETELILIVVPALYHLRYAEVLAPQLKDGQHVVLIPGTFGAFEFATRTREDGCRAAVTVSELDTLPYATRITGPTSVNVYHSLPVFGIGTFPANRRSEVHAVFADLYPGAAQFRDALEAGLSNCNPVIHPLGVLMNAGR